jgi:hypothetical protein
MNLLNFRNIGNGFSAERIHPLVDVGLEEIGN